MSFYIKYAFASLLCLLVGCSPSSNEDFREAGRSISRSIIKELHQVHTHDDLVRRYLQLEKLFDRFSDVMIAARTFNISQCHSTSLPLSKEDHNISDRLRVELNRIFLIPGGKELIQKAQQKALDKVDKFEKKLHK